MAASSTLSRRLFSVSRRSKALPSLSNMGYEQRMPILHHNTSLQCLVHDIRDCFGSRPIPRSIADVPVNSLKGMLNSYMPLYGEWSRFGRADRNIPYTRLLVDSMPGRFNLLFIVWNSGRRSPIHDHADSHCIMKIVHGSLRETVYRMPESCNQVMQPELTNIHSAGELAYISDDIGLHDVGNDDPHDVAVSLHLYTPPNAAETGFHVFDAQTGRATMMPAARCHNETLIDT